jgi:hypothetical protein
VTSSVAKVKEDKLKIALEVQTHAFGKAGHNEIQSGLLIRWRLIFIGSDNMLQTGSCCFYWAAAGNYCLVIEQQCYNR